MPIQKMLLLPFLLYKKLKYWKMENIVMPDYRAAVKKADVNFSEDYAYAHIYDRLDIHEKHWLTIKTTRRLFYNVVKRTKSKNDILYFVRILSFIFTQPEELWVFSQLRFSSSIRSLLFEAIHYSIKISDYQSHELFKEKLRLYFILRDISFFNESKTTSLADA